MENSTPHPFDKPIPGVGMFHTPQFAVHGKARKALIKKRNFLRSALREIPHIVSVNNDLYTIYGEPQHVVSDQDLKKRLTSIQSELDELNDTLNKPFKAQEPKAG